MRTLDQKPPPYRRYLHGYTASEQQRLVHQAKYWSNSLIPVGLRYRPGDRVLEIGCAAGASLCVLARTFPGIEVTGIGPRFTQTQSSVPWAGSG